MEAAAPEGPSYPFVADESLDQQVINIGATVATEINIIQDNRSDDWRSEIKAVISKAENTINKLDEAQGNIIPGTPGTPGTDGTPITTGQYDPRLGDNLAYWT